MDNPREDFEIAAYEGLVNSTARMYEAEARKRGVDFDDLRQMLRISVWKAIEAYDPGRSRMPLRRFVFGCLANRVKDVLKKKVRTGNEVHLESLLDTTNHHRPTAHDSSTNALRYFSTSEESAFAEVDPDQPVLPQSLTEPERIVALMLIDDYREPLIAQHLGCRRAEVRAHIAAIRLKMGGAILTIYTEAVA